MTQPEADLDALMARVRTLEKLDSFTPDELDDYVSAESRLEQLMFARSVDASTNCEFNDANALLEIIIELNVTMREIADRELPRPDWDEEHQGLLRHVRTEADSMTLLMQAYRLGNNADAAVINGDPAYAQERLNDSLVYLNQVVEANGSAALFAQLRMLIISGQVPLYEALQQLRSGNFQGAHGQFDEAIARFTELREALAEESAHDSPDDADHQGLYQDLYRELGEGLSSALALQGMVDMMLAVQHGDFSEAIERGRYAAPLYDASVTAAQAAGRPRNLIAVRETERAYLHGWLALCEAEQSIDLQDWDGCRQHLTVARDHWTTMSRLLIRNLFVGVMAHRPDTGSLEMLLRGTARRCERERRLTTQIDRLTQQLGTALGHSVAFYSSVTATAQADAQSRPEMPQQEVPMSEIHFHGPVSGVAAIGNDNLVVNPAITTDTRAASPMGDLTELAAALVSLREAMSGVSLRADEQQSLEQIREAEAAARRSDEPEVRKRLAAAGRWALNVAEHLGLAAVTTAVKYAMGG